MSSRKPIPKPLIEYLRLLADKFESGEFTLIAGSTLMEPEPASIDVRPIWEPIKPTEMVRHVQFSLDYTTGVKQS